MEFALVFPVLLLFMLGIMEFGRVLFIYTEVSNAAREALRAAAVTIHRSNDADRGKVTIAECNEVLNRAYGTLALTPRSQVTITVEYRRPDGSGSFLPLGRCSSDPAQIGLPTTDVLALNDLVYVDVQSQVSAATPLIRPFVSNLPLRFAGMRSVVPISGIAMPKP
ncbi:TadE family protein [Thermoflexus sp.]|uniref:TadE family protein n=1 Tax=Thermoflexus sp. TaxID=1969742 RepID=UPI0035E45AD8